MDRKSFFKSSLGLIVAGVFSKSIVESLKIEDTDAEKMLKGAKRIDEDFKMSVEKMLKRFIIEDENGECFIAIKPD